MRETPCPVSGCSEVFVNQDAHNLHLKQVHSLTGERLHELSLAAKKRKAAWEEKAGCAAAKVILKRGPAKRTI